MLTVTSGLDPFRDRWFFGWFGIWSTLMLNILSPWELKHNLETGLTNKIWPTKSAYRSSTMSSLLSLHPLMLCLLSGSSLRLFYFKTLAKSRMGTRWWIKWRDSCGVHEYQASVPPVNCPCGIWSPKEKIKNSFCYASVIVVSPVVIMFDI